MPFSPVLLPTSYHLPQSPSSPSPIIIFDKPSSEERKAAGESKKDLGPDSNSPMVFGVITELSQGEKE